MTVQELYDFCKKYNIEDAVLSYPMFDGSDVWATVNKADVILTSDDERVRILLRNEIKMDESMRKNLARI